jgi:EXLDI family protein
VPGEATLEVAGSIEDLRDKMPAEFYDRVAGLAQEPAVEDLDI